MLSCSVHKCGLQMKVNQIVVNVSVHFPGQLLMSSERSRIEEEKELGKYIGMYLHLLIMFPQLQDVFGLHDKTYTAASLYHVHPCTALKHHNDHHYNEPSSVVISGSFHSPCTNHYTAYAVLLLYQWHWLFLSALKENHDKRDATTAIHRIYQ